MEKFQEAREKAKRNLQIADHMVYMTYTLVKDPKLLLSIMENVFLALTNSMTSVLQYENLFKRVPPFPENFEAKFALFRQDCAQRYKISQEHLDLLRDVKDIIVEHKKSPVEFVKNGQFVICTPNYEVLFVSIEQVKRYIVQTKQFVSDMNKIISQDEGIFTTR